MLYVNSCPAPLPPSVDRQELCGCGGWRAGHKFHYHCISTHLHLMQELDAPPLCPLGFHEKQTEYWEFLDKSLESRFAGGFRGRYGQ